MVDYLTVAQIKAYAPTNEIETSTTWDTMLATLCTNLSRAWDTLTFRQAGDYLVSVPATRYYDGVPRTAAYPDVIQIGEIAAVPTSVSISPNGNPAGFIALQATDFFMYPYNAGTVGKPYTQVRLNQATGSFKSWPTRQRSIQVVGLFGYSTMVPADVIEALLLYAIRMVRKAQTNYLEVGTLLDTGQVMVGMKRDPDISDLISVYRQWRDGVSY